MFFPPYRNPPYRTPIPSPRLAQTSLETLIQKHPKVPDIKAHLRGRERAPQVATVMVNDTDTSRELNETMTGSRSPRSAIADSLNNLDLQQQVPRQPSISPNKRKRGQDVTIGELDAILLKDRQIIMGLNPRGDPAEVCSSAREVYLATASPSEITEHDKKVVPGTKSISPPAHINMPYQEKLALTTTVKPTEANKSSENLIIKIKDKVFDRYTLQNIKAAKETSPGREPLVSEDSFDRATLTWQDEEITGYYIDPANPDDDGEGINGIGFRPTPAIAYARSQKRRRQVALWRAQEAKEAREQRMDRRRGTSMKHISCSPPQAKRAVRFAVQE